MTNIINSRDEFDDIGFFKSKKCRKTGNKIICELKFTRGKVTLSKDELKRVCKK